MYSSYLRLISQCNTVAYWCVFNCFWASVEIHEIKCIRLCFSIKGKIFCTLLHTKYFTVAWNVATESWLIQLCLSVRLKCQKDNTIVKKMVDLDVNQIPTSSHGKVEFPCDKREPSLSLGTAVLRNGVEVCGSSSRPSSPAQLTFSGWTRVLGPVGRHSLMSQVLTVHWAL